jgi:polyisoprenoid-binding protein YceI
MTSTTATALRDGTWTVPAGRPTATFGARNFGVLTVRGTLAIDRGSVTVAGGRPVAAEGMLRAASVKSGMPKRDEHLCGAQFLNAAEHPEVGLRALRFEPAEDGWTVPAMLTVAGVEAPITLHAQRLPDTGPGTVRVRITGEFDRRTLGIRAPRFMVGHRVAVEAELALTPR